MPTIDRTPAPSLNHHREVSAYEAFIRSDLEAIRKHRNGGRKPFGLLFELPAHQSLAPLASVFNSTSKPRRKRHSDEQSPARCKPLLELEKNCLWELYEDVNVEGKEPGNVESTTCKVLMEGKEEEQDQAQEEEEESHDENENIHRIPQPTTCLTNVHPPSTSKDLSESTEIWARTAENIFGGLSRTIS